MTEPWWKMSSSLASQRLYLFAAMGLMTLCNLPVFSDGWFPVHDNLLRYHIFQFFYSHWVTHGTLPWWLPYDNYGVASFMYQWSITPWGYLVGLVAGLAGAEDTLALFKTVTWLETQIYILGVGVLAWQLFREPAVRWLMVIGGCFSLVWWFQPNFNFHVYYLLPWVIFFFHGFLVRQQASWFWLAVLTAVVQEMGSILYYIPVHVWTLLLIALPSLLVTPGWYRLLMQRNGRLLAGWVLMVAAVLATLVLHLMDGMVSLGPGRDPVSHQASVDSFLNHVWYPLGTVLAGLLGDALSTDNIYYFLGWLPWLGFGYGLLRVRHPLFLGLALAIAWLFWLSLGGPFALLVYHMPGMSYFRHLGFLPGYAKILVLLASGFGFQAMFQRWTATGEPPAPGCDRSCRYLVLILGLMVVDSWLTWTPNGSFYIKLPTFPDWQEVAAARLAAYLLAWFGVWRLLRMGRGKAAIHLLVVLYAAEMGGHYLRFMLDEPYLATPVPAAWTRVTALPFVAQRSAITEGPEPGMPRLWGEMMGQRHHEQATTFSFSYHILAHDPCYPQYYNLFITPAVREMIRLRGGKPDRLAGPGYLPRQDAGLLAVLGCGTPKLQWIDRHYLTGDQAMARELFARLRDPSLDFVLQGDGLALSQQVIHEQLAESGEPGSLQVVDFSANHLRLRVAVHASTPVWLHYADAYHPAWQAELDGRHRLSVWRSQVGFKAVQVPPGEHELLWVFRPGLTGWLAQLAAALGAMLALAGGVMLVNASAAGWSLGREAARPRFPYPSRPDRG